jgi:hypothetical protein
MTMRAARPTDNLAGIADVYAKGLGFSVLARFAEHEGFDGVILGAPEQPYHLEFTAHRGHVAGKAPRKITCWCSTSLIERRGKTVVQA